MNPQVKDFWDQSVMLKEVRIVPGQEFQYYSNDDPALWAKLPKDKVNNRDYTDVPMSYKWNSDGWRCADFDTPCDYRLLIAGDSFVLGEGVPYENMWSYKLSEYFQKRLDSVVPYFGLGFVGAGSKRILRNIMSYSSKWKTDRVLAMIPACSRFTIAGVNNYKRFNFYDSQTSHRILGEDFDSKLLYQAINDETFFLHWVQDILMMKMHCDLKGIPFNWTTWDGYMKLDLLPGELQDCFIETRVHHNFVPHKDARDGLHPGENYQLATLQALMDYYDTISLRK